MAPKSMAEVLDLYEKELIARGAVPQAISHHVRLGLLTAFYYKHSVLSHLRQMVPHMRVYLKEGRSEKLMRWLGFIQGALWILGVYSIEELKEHNSPPAEGSKTSKESA